MGVGSILGSLAGFIPGVGPVLSGVLKGAGGLADVFGGASKSGLDQQNKDNSLKLLLEQAKLNRDKFATDAPGQRLNTSTRASVLSNYKPAQVDWGAGGFQPGMGARGVIPKITGGVGGSLANLNPETKSLADQVMHDMLVSQQRGGETGGGNGAGAPYSRPDKYGTDKTMPTMTQPSRGDKLTGGLGMGFSILEALKKSGVFGNRGGSNDGYDDMYEAGGG